jgi:RND family efflux transporter MFP subunit
VGAAVVEKQPILTLTPLLSPAERITLSTQQVDAGGQVQQAQTQVEANEIALNRAERLVRESVGSARVVDEAKAQLQLSQKALQAAISRKKILDQTLQTVESEGDQPSFVIESPQKGILRAIHVTPDEIVAAGAVLFEVMNADLIWVRVPVYVGEISAIATDKPASIGDLASKPGQPLLTAEPITAPPTATALSSTVDLYFQLSNQSGSLRPGQRISVQLPLTGDTDERVVPWSAIVHDIHGGDWIYEQTAEHKYARRRVEVKRVIDSLAVLGQGPAVGTTVVSNGVAELFGTEFWKQ